MSAAGTVLHPDISGTGTDVVVAAARKGMPWALRFVYEAFAPAVTGYAVALGSPDVAGVTDRVFRAAFTDLDSMPGDADALRSWVFGLAQRALRDEPLAAEGSDRPPAAALLSCLPPTERDVLALRLVADLTLEQTAEVIGRPASAVLALQRRGLNHLRALVLRSAP